MLDAENGDIVIKAPNGRIRMEAINVDILAIGGDGNNGNVQIEANEKVLVKTKAFDVQSKVSTKIFSEKTVDVIGNSICNLYGGILDCALMDPQRSSDPKHHQQMKNKTERGQHEGT